MKKGIRLKDIASKLNMSISTVSKSLSSHRSISPLTKRRVEELAKQWGYVPNESARHFKLNKTFTIGLILPDLTDQFFVSAINGVEKIAENEKYNIILGQTHEDVIKEENIADVMFKNRLDGLIVAVTKDTVDTTFLEKFKCIGTPVVCIIREPTEHSFNCISINNEEGAFKATNFLIERGHRRVAHIAGPKTLQISQLRLNGYKQALEKNHIPFDPGLVKGVDFSREQTEQAMQDLMSLPKPPTAFFTFKNCISLDAIDYLKRNCPDRLASVDFTDFGNLSVFHYLDHKPVASIEENFFEVGKEAATLLFKMIKDDDTSEAYKPVHLKIPCELIVH